MIIRRIDENIIHDIGHTFAYYDYGDEKEIVTAFPDKNAAALYIFGYARGMLNGGFTRTTSGRGEGFIETDAVAKVDRYVHLGTELAGTRDFWEYGKLYDLIRHPVGTGK